MTIEITPETADALLKINDRYFNGLFEEIVTSEDEEMDFRDALEEIAKAIQE